MTETDTTSGRIWVTEIAGPKSIGSPRRIKVAASERPDRDRDQCCLACDLVLDVDEAREVAEKLRRFAAEGERE